MSKQQYTHTTPNKIMTRNNPSLRCSQRFIPGRPGQPGSAPERRPNWSKFMNILLMFFCLTFLFNLLFANRLSTPAVQIGYSQFMALVDEGWYSRRDNEERLSDAERRCDIQRVSKALGLPHRTIRNQPKQHLYGDSDGRPGADQAPV